VKSGFRFPWQKRAAAKVINTHAKKYDEIRKGTLDNFLESKL
jgi:hypothetical protein